jgi:hypothetical protein
MAQVYFLACISFVHGKPPQLLAASYNFDPLVQNDFKKRRAMQRALLFLTRVIVDRRRERGRFQCQITPVNHEHGNDRCYFDTVRRVEPSSLAPTGAPSHETGFVCVANREATACTMFSFLRAARLEWEARQIREKDPQMLLDSLFEIVFSPKWFRIEKTLMQPRNRWYGTLQGVLLHEERIEDLMLRYNILNETCCRMFLLL